MNQLDTIRKYVEYQQYAELGAAALAYWDETAQASVLPLLLLSHAQLGRRDKAHETLALIRAHQTQLDTDALVDFGGALLVMLRLDQAVEILELALDRRPGHGLGTARLAWCRMAMGDLNAARQLFIRAVELEPGRIPILNNLATVCLLQKDPEQAQQMVNEARNTLERQSNEFPDFVIHQYAETLDLMQVQIWVDQERFAVAEEWLAGLHQEGRGYDPGQASATIVRVGHYARMLAEADRHDQAADVLKAYLTHFPGNGELHRKMAELAQVQGRFVQAAALLHQAIKEDEDNIDLWVQLSQACLNLFDGQARQAAEKAMELAGALTESDQMPAFGIKASQARAKNALAQVEGHEQNYNTAEKIYRDILADHEFFVSALQGLGQMQMQRGNVDEAVELFERVRRIDPVKGQSVLINAHHFPEDIQILERMELAAEKPSLEGSVRSGILFNLAAAWEKRGEYGKAMGFAHRANKATRRFLPYDARDHRNRCARIRAVFSRALFDHRRDCGHDATLPVYVLGMPRSGTTLVEQIIAGHSQIFGAGELDVIPSRVQGLNRWERHVGSGRKYPDCIDDLNPCITHGIAKGVLDELQEMAAQDKPRARHVVDKLPHNFENVGLIKFLFPNAKMISVRRDPRDIAMSNYFTDYQAKHGGMGFAYDLTDIGEQLADHNLLMHHWNQVFPGQILEINYEEVIEDLEGSARKMLDYIGVDWEPEVLRFNELDRPVKTASMWQVRQPIYKTSRNRWKRYEKHLAALIKGTNAKIKWDPIKNWIILPEPAFLQDGVALYEKDDLAGAELSFKKLLHHNPEHGAANYMVGLVYCSIGNIAAGIPLLEKALRKCPWKKEWQDSLLRAYQEVGDVEKFDVLKRKISGRAKPQKRQEPAGITAGFVTPFNTAGG